MRSMLAHATLSQLARDYSDALTRAEAAARATRFSAPSHPPASTTPTLTPPPVSTSNPSGALTPPTPPTSPSTPPPVAPVAPNVPASRAPQPSTNTGTQPPSVAADSSGSAELRAADEPISPQDSNPVFGVVSARFGRAVSHMEHATHATHETTAQGTPPTTGNIGVSPASSASPVSPEDSFLSAHRLTDALIGAWHAFDQRGGDWSRPDIREELTHLRTLIDTYLTRGADPTPRLPSAPSTPTK